MKRLFCILFSSVIGFVAFSQETMTITTLGKTYKVSKNYIVEESRVYIEQNYSSVEAWVIIEKAYYRAGKWTDWEEAGSLPVNFYFSNQDLLAMAEQMYTALNCEFSDGDVKFVGVPSTDQNNQKYWWENRKYLCFLRRCYLIVK